MNVCKSCLSFGESRGKTNKQKKREKLKKKKNWPEKCVLTYIYSNEVLNELMHIVQCVLYIYFNAKSSPDDSCFIFVLQGEWMKLSSIKLYIFWAQTKWASLNSYICACVCVAVMLFSVSPILHHKHAFFPGYTRNERLTSSHFSDSYTQAGAHQFWQKSHIYFNIFNRFYPSVIMSVPSHQSPLQLHFFVVVVVASYKQQLHSQNKKGKKSNEWLPPQPSNLLTIQAPIFFLSLKAAFSNCSGCFALKPFSHAWSTCFSLKQHSLVPLCALFCPQKNCPDQDASWMLGTKQGNQTSPGKLYQLSYQDSGCWRCCLLRWFSSVTDTWVVKWHLGEGWHWWKKSALTDNLHR